MTSPIPPSGRPLGRRPLALVLSLLTLALAAPRMPAQGAPVAVRVAPVKRELVQEMRRVVGDVHAVRTSLVSGQEPGLVLELAVDEGDRVTAGDLLCRLDDRRLRVQQKSLDAQERSDDALLQQRRLEAERAERDAATLRDLSDRNATNPKELADAQSAAAVAAARVLEAEAALLSVQAERELLQTRLDDLLVRAPFAGTVVECHVDLGEWLSAGEAVASLMSAELEVWLDVPQDAFAVLMGGGEGAAIRATLDANGRALTLVDVHVVPSVDPGGRSFSVRGRLSGDGVGVAPGMSISAEVPTGARGSHLTVPLDALLRNDAGSYVYVAMGGAEGGPALATPMGVDVAFRSEGRAVLRDERLAPGMLVVVEGNERLAPMMPLQPQLAETAASPADAATTGGGR